MNSKAIGTILACLCTAMPALASADTGDVYVGLRGGVTRTGIDSGDLTLELRRRGHTGVTAAVDDKDAAGELYVGKMFSPKFGLELSLRSLGEYETAVTGTTPLTLEQLRHDVVDAGPKGGHAVAFGGRAQIPVAGSEVVIFAPRGGVLFWREDHDVFVGGGGVVNESNDGLGAFVALALEFHINRQFIFGLGAELVRPDSEGSNSQLFGQVEYRWGR